MTGHLLGAAGAIEAIASIMSIQKNIVPPTINHETPDEEIDPKITIAAITEVNKMTFAQHAAKTAEFNTQTPNTAGPEIRIPQDLLPAGELDK